MSKKKIPWQIHFIANGQICQCCGKRNGNIFLDGICNAHTHGLKEKYHHPEFQVVLHFETGLIGYTLNTLGERVRKGERFTDGQEITDLVSCRVKLKEVHEEGERYLRVIFPDPEFKMPDEKGCEYPYSMQLHKLSDLKRGKSGYHS